MKWIKDRVDYWCKEILEENFMGQGIGVAVLDTGMSAHPDLREKVLGFYDVISGKEEEFPYDDNGHGTHVAGILCGTGEMSQEWMYSGIAPEAKILPVKVLDREGNGEVSHVLEGISWISEHAERYGIRIVNISAGTRPDLGEEQKQRFLEGVEQLWDQGLVVIVSAGNYGPEKGTVAVPGNSRKVITVGVPDRYPLCSRKPVREWNYSGRGPTEECVIKPDLFAPGTGIISCNSLYGRKGEHPYIMKTGTSMAAPVVSGAVACLLSKYPDMGNVEVKLKLRQSCSKVRGTESGWGMLNVRRLMEV